MAGRSVDASGSPNRARAQFAADGMKPTGSGSAVLPVLRLSQRGFFAAGLFLLAAGAVFSWIFFVASKNPADSGESGILLLPFAMPWIMIIPGKWLGLWTGIGCILLNAVILYCVFGGLRFGKSAR